MGRTKKLVKNLSFIAIGNIGSKLMGFIMLPLYTSWLSPADYGLTDIISVYAALLLNVIACDISDAIYIFPIGADKKKIREYYSTGFFFQIFCTLVAIPLFYVFTLFNSDNAIFQYSWYVYGILISSLFQKYTQDFCRGIGKMSVFSFTGIVQSGVMAGFSLLMIPVMGVGGFVLATIISNVVTASFTFFYSRSYEYLSMNNFSRVSLVEMLRYTVPLIPTAVLWWFVNGLNRPLLENYCGFASIGLMAVALKLPSIINLVFNFFQQAWIVAVVEEIKSPTFVEYYNRMFRVVFAAQTIGCVCIIIIAKPFISIMTTQEFYSAYKYIPLLTIGSIFCNMTAFLGTVFSAFHNSRYTMYTVVFGGLTAIAANLLFIPLWGLWGACLAIVMAHIVSTVTRIIFSSRYVKFSNTCFLVYQIIPIVMAYLSMAFLSGIVLLIGYVACFAMYWVLNRNSIMSVVFLVRYNIKKKNKYN